MSRKGDLKIKMKYTAQINNLGCFIDVNYFIKISFFVSVNSPAVIL
jgi:hypothetical protein